MGLDPELVSQLADWIASRQLGSADLLFATREGTPISRNTFRTRVWRPAVVASGVDFPSGSTTFATLMPPGSLAAPISSP